MPRDKMIRVVVSKDEAAKAKKLADVHGMTVSSYLRYLIATTEIPKRQQAA